MSPNCHMCGEVWTRGLSIPLAFTLKKGRSRRLRLCPKCITLLENQIQGWNSKKPATANLQRRITWNETMRKRRAMKTLVLDDQKA